MESYGISLLLTFETNSSRAQRPVLWWPYTILYTLLVYSVSTLCVAHGDYDRNLTDIHQLHPFLKCMYVCTCSGHIHATFMMSGVLWPADWSMWNMFRSCGALVSPTIHFIQSLPGPGPKVQAPRPTILRWGALVLLLSPPDSWLSLKAAYACLMYIHVQYYLWFTSRDPRAKF